MKESYIINAIKKVLLDALKLTNYQVETSMLSVEINQQKSNFGDYASTIALQLAKQYHKNPFEIAQEIVEKIAKNDLVAKVEVIKPGFINFHINVTSFYQVLVDVINQKEVYGKLAKNNLKYNVEFVSANPTGLLHLGHARNAAIGSSLANILEYRGYEIVREYYINDAGNQINILAQSIYARYQNLCGAEMALAEDSYRGPEIIQAAQAFKAKYDLQYYQKELNSEVNRVFADFGIKYMLEEIKNDLLDFDVNMDIWFHESSLYHEGKIKKILENLASTKSSYQADGATWLISKKYGDSKDRVIVKSDGTYTYMLPDLTYHNIKYHRSNLMINIWGADHSGYIARIKAGLAALGDDPEKLIIVPTQMVRLVQNGVEQKMSKRAGTAITMKDLLQTVGKDVLRYFMISRASETHLDIDIDVAKSKNQDNPVFYLQYAHARINQVVSQVENFKMPKSINLLTNKKEKELLILIDEYILILNRIVSTYQPHLLANYLQRLAKNFHSYYNECKIINIENQELTEQRLTLALAVKYLLSNGLKLIGVSAPNKM